MCRETSIIWGKNILAVLLDLYNYPHICRNFIAVERVVVACVPRRVRIHRAMNLFNNIMSSRNYMCCNDTFLTASLLAIFRDTMYNIHIATGIFALAEDSNEERFLTKILSASNVPHINQQRKYDVSACSSARVLFTERYDIAHIK